MRNTRVFGSLCFVWQPKSKAENVGKAKALKCIYVGGGQDSMSNRADSCWQCIDPITGREHLTYHATTVEDSSSRCTWLEKVHGTVGALRAEISSFDKSGLGCPDISTLTKQQMMTIIYEKNLTCLAAMFKDPRSPYFTLDPEDVNSSLTKPHFGMTTKRLKLIVSLRSKMRIQVRKWCIIRLNWNPWCRIVLTVPNVLIGSV